eukprot:scaffold6878_cov159-Ochromonas_danica.AAC.1
MAKKILLVIAHTSTKGTSHKLAHRYETRAVSLGCEVKVHDLYRDPKALSYAAFEEVTEDAPAIPKNFYDVAFIAAGQACEVHCVHRGPISWVWLLSLLPGRCAWVMLVS